MIPTLHEAGLAGFDTSQWIGIFAPAGTPRPVVDRVRAEVAAALKLPDVVERLSRGALVPVGSTPEQFAGRISIAGARSQPRSGCSRSDAAGIGRSSAARFVARPLKDYIWVVDSRRPPP